MPRQSKCKRCRKPFTKLSISHKACPVDCATTNPLCAGCFIDMDAPLEIEPEEECSEQQN